jgi:DNA invertase Pin-like site-specific DNA recombinase
MERVAALLRVSTLRQARKHRDDEETLPVQREAIRRFCSSRSNWKLVKEYAEEGVSAYLNSIEDRGIIQEILVDAKDKQFSTLVLFKYDRLARQCLDYLTLLVDLKKMGVRVWTVADDGTGRDLKLENLMDYLLRFLEGWQGQNESYNTSIRVSAKMRQMAEQGIWTGGKPPYGFRLKGGGKTRNGGLQSLEIDEVESEIVRYIFYMYLDLKVGSTTIARRLNDEGYRLRNGKEWHDTAVREMINNPTVAGRPAYGRHYRDGTTGTWRNRPKGSPEIIIAPETISDLEIIPWERWLQGQKRMAQWQPQKTEGPVEDHRTKAETGPLLLTGIARCGYCEGPITAGWSMPVKTLKDGTKARYRYPRYVDRNRYGGQSCEGQSSYSVKKLDSVVMAHVRTMLENMGSNIIYEKVRQQIAQGAFQQTQRLKLARKREQDAGRILKECTKRWKEWLLQPEDERKYSEEFLTEQIREVEEDIKQAKAELERLERNGSDTETRLKRLDEFLQVAPMFWQNFLAADPKQQKIMLRHLLDKVVVYHDSIEVHWRINIAEIMGKETSDVLEWQDKVEIA